MKSSWLDRAIGSVSPGWQVRRLKSRIKIDLVERHYEGASTGRRTQGWKRPTTDANAAIGPALAHLRNAARDLVRNNPYAESALATICDHTVGWGIKAKAQPANARVMKVWNAWAESTNCDADGRHDLYGLQHLCMRTIVESGEVLVRRRLRLPSDGLPIPLQLQVLDPDFLDTSRDTATGLPASGGNVVIQGVEYDGLGKRVAYWLFREHPGSVSGTMPVSVRVPAESVLHLFRPLRPGQVRGPSWFAPVLMRFKDFDEFEDATGMKQKIAACLAVLVSDDAGDIGGVGTADDTVTPALDYLEPGAIKTLRPGQNIQVVNPPRVDEYDTYSRTVLRAIATGLGVTYEDLTGDYADMPFSAARMSRLKHWARVEDWRWRILIPQLCDPVWVWAMQAAGAANLVPADVPAPRWSAPPAPMIDPVNEGLAAQRLIRSGLETLSGILRERGYDPDEHFAEMAADNAKLDKLKIIIDSDPRLMTQAGQAQPPKSQEAPATDPGDPEDEEATQIDPEADQRARLRIAARKAAGR